MAIRHSHHDDRGFTLIEMVVILAIVGIVSAFALPSLLSFNKPLRDGTNQFTSQLALIRSKAISSSKAYRIRPKYPTKPEYVGTKYSQVPRNFIVEYAGSCQVNTYGPGLAAGSTVSGTTYANGTSDGWQAASQLDLDLPESVGIDTRAVETPPKSEITGITITLPPVAPSTTATTISPISAILLNDTRTDAGTQTVNFKRANLSGDTDITFDPIFNWSICYDNRGMYYSARLDRSPVAASSIRILFKDYQGNNRSANSLVTVLGIGEVNILTYDKSGNGTGTPGNPVY